MLQIDVFVTADKKLQIRLCPIYLAMQSPSHSVLFNNLFQCALPRYTLKPIIQPNDFNDPNKNKIIFFLDIYV